jgi:uncharacterized membrane protein YqjE
MGDESDHSEGQRGGVLSSVKRLVGTIAATVHNRIELLVVELQEEGVRLVGTLLLAGAVVLFSGLALIVGMFTILLAVSEEHRLTAAIVMTLVLLAAAAGSALWLSTRLKNWSAFSGTRAELRKDREWLQSNPSEH